jgi:hypothetical protein
MCISTFLFHSTTFRDNRINITFIVISYFLTIKTTQCVITHYRHDKARHSLDVVVLIDCNGHDADKYQHLDMKGVH